MVLGNATAGGAYYPGLSDYIVMVKNQSKVSPCINLGIVKYFLHYYNAFLAGPPLVKMATGEEVDDETLGGAEMHSKVSII